MARDGAIGKEVYAQVSDAKAKSPGKTLTEIFREVAERRGATPGTTAANYCRVARAQGASKRRKRRGKAAASAGNTPATTSGTGRRNGAADIDRLTADLVNSVTARADAVKAQAKDVSELRSRLEGVRKVIN